MDHSTRWSLPSPSLDGHDTPVDLPQLFHDRDAILDKTAMLDSGPLASRPVSTSSSPGKIGRIYITLDQPVGAPTPRLEIDYGTGWLVIGGVPAGVTAPFAGPNVPPGWLVCDGRAISRTNFADLYNAIGTTHGAGDGSTTFNLPDYRGRMPIGKAASGTASTLGERGGTLGHQHVLPQIQIGNQTIPGLSVGVAVLGHSHPLSQNGGAQITPIGRHTSYGQFSTVGYNVQTDADYGSATVTSPGGTHSAQALCGNTDSTSNYIATGGTVASATPSLFTPTGIQTGTADPPFLATPIIIKV